MRKIMTKKTFKIPCEWSLYGVLSIEAKSTQEAIIIARKEAKICALPEGSYIDGSFELNLDEDLIEIINKKEANV